MVAEVNFAEGGLRRDGSADPGVGFAAVGPFASAQPAAEPVSWQAAAADPGAQPEGRASRCIGVQAAVSRRASRGMQTVEHACDTCVVFLELSQKVCQCQADVSCLADRLSELSSSALLAGQERARLADEVAATHERMDKKGMSGLTDAVLRQSETNVRALRLNARHGRLALSYSQTSGRCWT